jgi:pilus assembly protein FimV
MNLRKIAVQLLISLILVTAISAANSQQGNLRGPKSVTPKIFEPQQQFQKGIRSSIYGPIVSSDTLWQISQNYHPNNSLSIYQVMQAIFELNPGAFEHQNINFLKKGSMLRMPSENYISGINRKQAQKKSELDSQNLQTKTSKQPSLQTKNTTPSDQTQELIDKKLMAIDESQNRQFLAIQEQFSESISSVQNILDENKRLFERLDKVNADIDGMRSEEQQKSLQMNQMGKSIEELLDKSRQDDAKKVAQLAQKNTSWLDSSIIIILLFTLPVLLAFTASAYWMIKRKSLAVLKSEKADIDDFSLDPISAEIDDLSDALSAELSGEGNDDSEGINKDVLQNLDKEIALQNQEPDSITGSLIDELEQTEQTSSMIPDDDDELPEGEESQLDIQKLDDLREEVDEFSEEDKDDKIEIDISEVLNETLQSAASEELAETESAVETEALADLESAEEVEWSVESEAEAEALVDLESTAEVEASVDLESTVEVEASVDLESTVEVEASVELESAVEAEVSVETELADESEASVEPELAVESEVSTDLESAVAAEMSVEPESTVESEASVESAEAQESVVPDEITEAEECVESEPQIDDNIDDEGLFDTELSLEKGFEVPANSDELLDADQLEKALEDFDKEDFDKEDLDGVLEDLTSNVSAPISSLDDLKFSANDFATKNQTSQSAPLPTLDGLETIEDFDDSELDNAFDEDFGEESLESLPNNRDDLPRRGEWLDEDVVKPDDKQMETAEGKYVIEELEDLSFDEMLESIDFDNELSVAAGEKEDEEDTGVDITALLDESHQSKDLGTNEQDAEDFLDVESLLNESVSAESGDEIDKVLDLEFPLEPFVTEQDNLRMIDVDADEGLGAKLDLAYAYIEIGEKASAKELLDEILQKGNAEQVVEVKIILDSLDK